jgi:hypothetical protein
VGPQGEVLLTTLMYANPYLFYSMVAPWDTDPLQYFSLQLGH